MAQHARAATGQAAGKPRTSAGHGSTRCEDHSACCTHGAAAAPTAHHPSGAASGSPFRRFILARIWRAVPLSYSIRSSPCARRGGHSADAAPPAYRTRTLVALSRAHPRASPRLLHAHQHGRVARHHARDVDAGHEARQLRKARLRRLDVQHAQLAGRLQVCLGSVANARARARRLRGGRRSERVRARPRARAPAPPHRRPASARAGAAVPPSAPPRPAPAVPAARSPCAPRPRWGRTRRVAAPARPRAAAFAAGLLSRASVVCQCLAQ